MGADLFGMEIDYIGSNANYNGNISSLKWKSAGQANRQSYFHQYDKLNRLSSSNYVEQEAGGGFTNAGRYNTDYTYDLNSNIDTLMREGMLPGGTFGQIDNLNYAYAGDGKLNHITENSSSDAGFKSVPSELANFTNMTAMAIPLMMTIRG